MKEGNIKKILAAIVVAIIVLAIFVGIIFKNEVIEEKGLDLFAEIRVDENTGIAPFNVSFKAFVLNNEGKVDYSWDFGDGNTSDKIDPTHTYTNNGTYECNLTIIDTSNRKATDSILMSVKKNQKPTVSIEAETDKPRRPKNLLLEYILPIIIHVEFFNSNDYRELEKKGYLDPLFKNMDSFYSIEAFANDPDGDEIVSYNWTLRPPSYTTRFGNKPVSPIFYYSGKKIDIPAKDIYPAVEYSLTLTVTDSTGEQRSENFQFMVEKSADRVTYEGRRYQITNAINKWVSQYHSSIIVGGIVLGAAFYILKGLKNNVPEHLSLPLAKLLVMIFVELFLQTSPDEYTDESYIDVIKRIVYKDRLIFRNLNSEKFKEWFDKAEELSEKLALDNLSLALQLLEEEVGLDNSRPKIFDPYPEHMETFVDLNTKKVFVTVEDREGDPFIVHIFDENGHIDTSTGYYEMGQHNGSFNATLNTLNPSEEVTWKVLVIDQNGKEVLETYKFTTGYE